MPTSKRSVLDELEFKIAVIERLDRLEFICRSLTISVPKEVFTVAEAAPLLQRSKYTVARLCRDGGLLAERADKGRGGVREWRISVDEVQRFRREGPRSSASCDVV